MTHGMLKELIEDFEAQLQEAQTRVETLTDIIDNLRMLNGLPNEDPAPPTALLQPRNTSLRPRGADAVRAIVAQRPGLWSRKQIHAEIERQGWNPSDDARKTANAVDAAIHRLAKSGELEKIEDRPGFYRFPSPGHEEVMAA